MTKIQTSRILGTARISEKANKEGCEVASTMTLASDNDEPLMVDACLTKCSMCSACFCSISITKTMTISKVRDQDLAESELFAILKISKRFANQGSKSEGVLGGFEGSFLVPFSLSSIYSVYFSLLFVLATVCSGCKSSPL